MKLITWLSLVSFVLAMYVLACAPSTLAQSQTNPPSGAGSRLNEQESRGQGLFMQRCSLCHLPKIVKPYKSAGPSLTGVLKGAKADKEPVVRQLILKGSPNMPGFEYGLTTSEIDDVIAYLKTLGV